MRSNHWEYLAHVLSAIGTALIITGLTAYFFFQQNRGSNPQYSSYSIPLLLVGALVLIAGIVAALQSRKKHESERYDVAPPPPPPLPPPPPWQQ
jgi:cbb3-type cytochrome oxidase subunit 3